MNSKNVTSKTMRSQTITNKDGGIAHGLKTELSMQPIRTDG